MSDVDWTNLLWWAGGGIAALAGLALLAWALFGDWLRTRNARPRRCPKCWYDLSGTESLTCSECGHEATSEKKLHQSRRRWRWASVALMLIVGGGGVIGWQQTRGYDWNRIKPVWWLKREGYGNSPEAYAARYELMRRVEGGELTEHQIHGLIEHALTLQAEPDYDWFGRKVILDNNWGDFVELAWEKNAANRQQLVRYLRQAVGPALQIKVRPLVRPGGAIPVTTSFGQPRLGAIWLQVLPQRNARIATCQIVEATVDGRSLRIHSPWNDLGLAFDAHLPDGMLYLLEGGLPTGEHEVRLVCDWDIPGHPGNRTNASSDRLTWQTVHLLTAHVATDDEIVVRSVADESLRDEIERSIAVVVEPQRAQWSSQKLENTIDVGFLSPPVPLSFDIVCSSAGNESYLGSMLVREGRQLTYRMTDLDFDDLSESGESVSLIFRPSAELAERTVDIAEIWGGEIVIENVPLREAPEEDS